MTHCSTTCSKTRDKAKKYRAVISEAVNTKLWDEWESIYTNLFDEDHEAHARKFYEEARGGYAARY